MKLRVKSIIWLPLENDQFIYDRDGNILGFLPFNGLSSSFSIKDAMHVIALKMKER